MSPLLEVVLLERAMWALIAIAILAGLALGYWSAARSVNERQRANRAQVAKLERSAETFKSTIQDLEGNLQKQLTSLEGTIAQLGGTISAAQRETLDAEKHIDLLESKTESATLTLEAIKRQVDVDVGELKRIEDEVRNNANRINQNTRHIDRLEVEVHSLVPSVGPNRDMHVG